MTSVFNRILKVLNTKQHYYNRLGLQMQHSIEQPVIDFQNFIVKSTDLPNSFQVWYSSQILHLWMILPPLQADPKLCQNLIDLVFVDVEDRLAKLDIPQERLLKKLWEQCLGMSKSYNTGLSSDINADRKILDTNLRNAIIRNVLQQRDYPNIADLSLKYIRSNLQYTTSLKIKDCEGTLEFPCKIKDLIN
eukprot:NODE_41_length_29768_cov_0.533924.p13 type:complete len:191 gc:universal NODE_41_length_29768_cov_0.533924:21267-21839(+)